MNKKRRYGPIISLNRVGKNNRVFKFYKMRTMYPYSEFLQEYALLKANGVVIAPSKAVNAGGVSVSGLEMSQNSMRYSWSAEEVDEKLKGIMKDIYEASVAAAKKYGMEGDLVAGANIAGFLKVADAMKAYGVV